MFTPAPTAKVVKREDSVPLDSLFDDLLEDDAKTADIPKSLPHVKKLGNWDTEHSDGTDVSFSGPKFDSTKY